jgi:hypothetical protein
MGVKGNQDFIYTNAVQVITMKPPNDKKKYQDFMKGEGYGALPLYLSHVKNEVQLEQEMVQEFTRQQFEQEQPPLQMMDEMERRNLIRQLKTKWDALYSVYQRKAHCKALEGPAIKLRKAEENGMDQIKSDIFLLSQLGPIYIKD